jgi:membrane associated rhomboid family serine protease
MAVFGSIWDDARHAFRMGNMVTRLVIINFAVFALVKIAYFLLWLGLQGDRAATMDIFDRALYWLCMPSDWKTLLFRLWTPFTSMFLHEGLGHFLGNLIALYLFGGIVGDLLGDRRVLPLYLLGGLVGNALFFLSAQFMPYVGTYALGASGAIMALAGATLILAPDYRVMLLLLGEVKVKYIVLVLVLLDLVGIANQSNTGGHAAHIGGFALGCLFVYRLRDGFDMAEPVNNLLDRIFGLFGSNRSRRKPKRKPQMAATRGGMAGKPAKGNAASDSPEEQSFQERLDTILDKIKADGYDSLSAEEKEFLFHASKK